MILDINNIEPKNEGLLTKAWPQSLEKRLSEFNQSCAPFYSQWQNGLNYIFMALIIRIISH